ncbi:MAG: glycosyltransferase family 2 protein [Maritimibacter sp.]|uniref:glycosyltransferase family 2 protein n=1 Tax=Maritimibacter sp. TaxID=2003363 RepID=UPI001D9178DB|nr:glycosyltransferase family 2 protein [Maritimibacter sp.]MBL6427640.1 glycosyltransferase family 2 protein [Maritimibacter sp.]
MTASLPRRTSVVIPCYNGAAFVAAAIDSCLSEGVPGGQIIVVDDGSTDATADVLAGYADRIRVRRQANAGASKARNAGLALVETPYMLFFDADDLYDGGIIAALEAEMIRSRADIGFGAIQNVRPDGSLGRRVRPPDPTDPQRFLEAWLSGHTVQTNSHMWRSAFLRGIGGYRAEMKTLEEIEVVVRGILAGATLAVTDTGQSLYIDRGNADRVRYGNSPEVIRSAVDGFAAVEASLNTHGQRRALGKRYYQQARSAFRQGYSALGHEALARARACGFRGHLGTRGHRILCGIFGLERKERWSGRQLR